MLRSFPRAAPNSSSIRGPSIRTALRSPQTKLPLCTSDAKKQQTRSVAGHAISNPSLSQIEKRWEAMPPQEQADLWMALRDRMKNDWHELTLQERKAAYWIAFGPHGPRAEPPPGQGWRVFRMTMTGIGISFVIFCAIRSQARPAPKTMNAQYQEMTNEYLKVGYAYEHASGINVLVSSFVVLTIWFRQKQKTEPITGISSEGYVGKGMVQSKPRKGGVPSDDE